MTETRGTESKSGQRHRVSELRYAKAEKELTVTFDDARSFSLPAEYVRVESPSAEVHGHTPSQKTTSGSRRHVGIMRISSRSAATP